MLIVFIHADCISIVQDCGVYQVPQGGGDAAWRARGRVAGSARSGSISLDELRLRPSQKVYQNLVIQKCDAEEVNHINKVKVTARKETEWRGGHGGGSCTPRLFARLADAQPRVVLAEVADGLRPDFHLGRRRAGLLLAPQHLVENHFKIL